MSTDERANLQSLVEPAAAYADIQHLSAVRVVTINSPAGGISTFPRLVLPFTVREWSESVIRPAGGAVTR